MYLANDSEGKNHVVFLFLFLLSQVGRANCHILIKEVAGGKNVAKEPKAVISTARIAC